MFEEQPLVFDCAGERLLGVLSRPQAAAQASQLAVLVVVGGPQYRAGSHRQFVQLARALASAGHSCLRFDVRGMGDSTGEPRHFENLDEDLRAAIDALMQHAPHVRGVALAGLCDGASAALMYVERQRDSRVAALCLLNPWLRSEEGLARAQLKHYYWQRVMSPEFWRKALSGGLSRSALAGFLQTMGKGLKRGSGHRPEGGNAAADFKETMRSGCARFGGPILVALSESDLTAREFAEQAASDPGWLQALARRSVQKLHLADADHTLSTAEHRVTFEEALIGFLRGCTAQTSPWATPSR